MGKYQKINFEGMDNANILEVENENVVESVSEVNIENIEESNVNHMTFTEKEKKAIAERTMAMSEDELVIALKCIKSDLLWNELRRRNSKMQEKIETVNEILGVSVSDVNPINESAWNGMVKRFSDVEERFTKITKGFGA